jgi:hypothetical protein
MNLKERGQQREWPSFRWHPHICMEELNKTTESFVPGGAIAQAVSRRLPTAAARVQTWVRSCGILWWTKVALGQVFSDNLGFPCQSTFHLLLHNHLHYHPRLAQWSRSGRSANSLTNQIKKALFVVAGIRTEIWTQNRRNRKRECSSLDSYPRSDWPSMCSKLSFYYSTMNIVLFFSFFVIYLDGLDLVCSHSELFNSETMNL